MRKGMSIIMLCALFLSSVQAKEQRNYIYCSKETKSQAQILWNSAKLNNINFSINVIDTIQYKTIVDSILSWNKKGVSSVFLLNKEIIDSRSYKNNYDLVVVPNPVILNKEGKLYYTINDPNLIVKIFLVVLYNSAGESTHNVTCSKVVGKTLFL